MWDSAANYSQITLKTRVRSYRTDKMLMEYDFDLVMIVENFKNVIRIKSRRRE